MNWDAADWRDELAKFKQYCDLIFSGPYSRKTEKEQASFVLLWIGTQGLETYNSWTWDDAEDRNNPSIIWEWFEQHVVPKINHKLARYQVQQFKQKIDESVDDFLTRCRNQASKCRFKDKIESDEWLIERLIVGTKHKKIQERLLEKSEQLTFNEAIDIARTYETTTSQLEQLESDKKDINAIKGNVNKHSSDKKPTKLKCNNCGLEHPLRPRDRCPAYGSRCMSCHKDNHRAKVCRSNPQRMTTTRSRHRNRGNPRSRHLSNSRDRRRRSASRNRRDGDESDLSDQFETITVGAITIFLHL